MAGAETKEWGSGVLQAFDDELLSHAWDVDTDIVKRIKFSQKGTVIVNVHRDIQTPFILQARGVEASTSIWENYVYNIDEAKPDIKVNNGGSLSMLTSKKFPILEEMLLTAVRLRLDSVSPLLLSLDIHRNLFLRGICSTQKNGKDSHSCKILCMRYYRSATRSIYMINSSG